MNMTSIPDFMLNRWIRFHQFRVVAQAGASVIVRRVWAPDRDTAAALLSEDGYRPVVVEKLGGA